MHGEDGRFGNRHRLLIRELRSLGNRYLAETKTIGSEAMYIGIGGLILLIILLVILF